MSGNIEEQLKEKQLELDLLQASFDEYMQSSKDLETELEEALAQQTSKYDELNKKKLALESKVSELQEKNLRLSKEYSVLDENFAKANEKIKILEHSIKSMECANDSLQTSVRILEATKEDLQSKLVRSEEEVVFLQTDIFELKSSLNEMGEKHVEEISNLKAQLQNSALPCNYAKENHSPVGVSDAPIFLDLVPDYSPLATNNLNGNKAAVISDKLSTEVKSLTSRLTSVISHRNELLNTIETSNVTIQELQDSLKTYEDREGETLNKLAEKDMLIGILQEQLNRGNNGFSSPTNANNSSVNMQRGAFFDNLISESGDDSVQLLKSEFGDYFQSKSYSSDHQSIVSLPLPPVSKSNSESVAPSTRRPKYADLPALTIQGVNTIQSFVETILEKEDINDMKQEIATMLMQFDKLRRNNAKLLVKMQALQGNIQVCCRTRPPNNNELAANGKVCIEVPDDTEITCFDAKSERWKSFFFDRVWNASAHQADVFADIEPMIATVIDGYNACIIAYGQTGSGKTYTMDGYGDDYGVSYRTIEKIFDLLKERKSEFEANVSSQSIPSTQLSTSPMAGRSRKSLLSPEGGASSLEMDGFDSALGEREGFSFSVDISMMEIYNEQVFDLLVDSPGNGNNNGGPHSGAPLDVRQEPDGNIIVPGLSKMSVSSLEDVMSVFGKGSANRATSSTNLNEHSSRSHLILSIDVSVRSGELACTKAKLLLVDLAGSERVKLSGVTGAAMKEAQHINKSLSALGDVMEALDAKAKYIPYRNSKLTYILQNCLGGNARTMMIVTICPTDITIEETLFTLQLATRVRRITTSAQIQKNTNVKNLETEIRKLKLELKDANKKKDVLGGALLEAKKEAKKAQEKEKEKASLSPVPAAPVSVSQQQHQQQLIEIKLRIAEDARKSAEQIAQQQKRQLAEYAAKLAEAREAREQTVADLETTQRSLKRTVEQAQKITAAYSKLAKLHAPGIGYEAEELKKSAFALENELASSLLTSSPLLEADLVLLRSPNAKAARSITPNPSCESKLDNRYGLDSTRNSLSATMPAPSGRPAAVRKSGSAVPSDRNSGKWARQFHSPIGSSFAADEFMEARSAEAVSSRSVNNRAVSATRAQRGMATTAFGFSPASSSAATTCSSRHSSRGSSRSASASSFRSPSTGGGSAIPRRQSSTAAGVYQSSASSVASSVSGDAMMASSVDKSRSRSSSGSVCGSVGSSSRRPRQNSKTSLSDAEEDVVSLYSSGSYLSSSDHGRMMMASSANLNSLSSRVSSVSQRTEMALKKHQMRMERIRREQGEAGKESQKLELN